MMHQNAPGGGSRGSGFSKNDLAGAVPRILQDVPRGTFRFIAQAKNANSSI
jgi:hypothetical protein